MFSSTMRSIFYKALAASGILTLALIVGGSLAGPTSASAAGSDDHWPGWIQGRPAGLDSGDINGWYFWHDGDGLHVRTTTPSDTGHDFVGVFVTDDQFIDISKVRLESEDDVKLTD